MDAQYSYPYCFSAMGHAVPESNCIHEIYR